MASVRIDTGPVDATDIASMVPREKWSLLVGARKHFLRVNLPYDCRELLRFVEEAEDMYAELGHESVEDFVRNGLGLDPKMVGWAINGIRSIRPEEPISFKRAIALGQHGGDRRSERAEDQGYNVTLNPGERGHARDYTLARLHRDRPDLAEKVETGELSANAAAIEAGFRKRYRQVPADPLEAVLKLLGELDGDQLREVAAIVEEHLGG